MKIIKPARIREFWARHRAARPSLEGWLAVTRAGNWRSLDDVRRTFPSADEVRVSSGRKVMVFNVAGNNYRLITAVHYNREKVFVMRFMTHAEYSKDRWKQTL